MPLRDTFLVVALGLLASGSTIKPVAAATASASIGVSATVQASCLAAIMPITNEARAAAADAASAVSVFCSNSVPYNIALDAGTAPLNAEATRSGPSAIVPRSSSRFRQLPIAPSAPSGRTVHSIVVVVTY
jgi:spore coat protein U-like protein